MYFLCSSRCRYVRVLISAPIHLCGVCAELHNNIYTFKRGLHTADAWHAYSRRPFHSLQEYQVAAPCTTPPAADELNNGNMSSFRIVRLPPRAKALYVFVCVSHFFLLFALSSQSAGDAQFRGFLAAGRDCCTLGAEYIVFMAIIVTHGNMHMRACLFYVSSAYGVSVCTCSPTTSRKTLSQTDLSGWRIVPKWLTTFCARKGVTNEL